MSKRNRTSEQLTAYLDGELAEGEVRRLEQALSSDPELARELAGLKATRALVRGLGREEAPTDFSRRVLARLERRTLLQPGVQENAGKPVRRWALAAAAVLVAGAATAVYFVITGLVDDGQPVAQRPEPKAPAEPAVASRDEKSGPEAAWTLPAAPAPRPSKVDRVTEALAARRAEGTGKASSSQPGGAAAAPAVSVYVPVNVAELTATRRGLEMAFFEMEIPPGAGDEDVAAEKEGAGGADGEMGYRPVTGSPGQVKYVVTNVRQSKLPGVLKKLEEFRRRQGERQEPLVSAQLALAEAPGGPADRQQGTSQAKALDRGAYLRSVLAEADRAEKADAAAHAQPAAPTTQQGLAGTVAVAQRGGPGRDDMSNAGVIERARGYVGDRGKAPKGTAPGDEAAGEPQAGTAGPQKPAAAKTPEPAGATAPAPAAKAKGSPAEAKKADGSVAIAEETPEEKLRALLESTPDDLLALVAGRDTAAAGGKGGASASQPAGQIGQGPGELHGLLRLPAREGAASGPAVNSKAWGADAGRPKAEIGQARGKGQGEPEPVYNVYVVLNVTGPADAPNADASAEPAPPTRPAQPAAKEE